MINKTLKTITFFALLVVTMTTVDGLIIDKSELLKSRQSSYTVEVITTDLGGGTGSAVAVNDSGKLVTNAHVVENAIIIKVTGSDGKSYEAKLIKIDGKLDLAIIQIASKIKTSPAQLGKDVTFGDRVYAVGASLSVPMQASIGVASSEVYFKDVGRRTPSDARLEHGNSGGGLFNSRGELVGINANMMYNHEALYIVINGKVMQSKNLFYANGQGISLSIPVSVVKEFLEAN